MLEYHQSAMAAKSHSIRDSATQAVAPENDPNGYAVSACGALTAKITQQYRCRSSAGNRQTQQVRWTPQHWAKNFRKVPEGCFPTCSALTAETEQQSRRSTSAFSNSASR